MALLKVQFAASASSTPETRYVQDDLSVGVNRYSIMPKIQELALHWNLITRLATNLALTEHSLISVMGSQSINFRNLSGIPYV